MRALTKKDTLRGTALLALHELRRTGETRFAVSQEGSRVSISVDLTLQYKMKRAALLAMEELSGRTDVAYRLAKDRRKERVTVLTGDKFDEGMIKDVESKAFARFGLEYRGGMKSGEDRVLYFSPAASFDLLSILRS